MEVARMSTSLEGSISRTRIRHLSCLWMTAGTCLTKEDADHWLRHLAVFMNSTLLIYSSISTFPPLLNIYYMLGT